jgi:hypothetical protein
VCPKTPWLADIRAAIIHLGRITMTERPYEKVKSPPPPLEADGLPILRGGPGSSSLQRLAALLGKYEALLYANGVRGSKAPCSNPSDVGTPSKPSV